VAGRFAIGAALAAVFVAGAAHAQEPLDPDTPTGAVGTAPVTVAELPGPAGSADSPLQIGNAGRPIFLGLIAASFLVLSAIAAERAEKRRKPPGSGRPGK